MSSQQPKERTIGSRFSRSDEIHTFQESTKYEMYLGAEESNDHYNYFKYESLETTKNDFNNDRDSSAIKSSRFSRSNLNPSAPEYVEAKLEEKDLSSTKVTATTDNQFLDWTEIDTKLDKKIDNEIFYDEEELDAELELPIAKKPEYQQNNSTGSRRDYSYSNRSDNRDRISSSSRYRYHDYYHPSTRHSRSSYRGMGRKTRRGDGFRRYNKRHIPNNRNSTPICKFWNPYFRSGCKNRGCEYQHLSHEEYLVYVKFVKPKKTFNAFSQRKFGDAMIYLKKGYTIKASKIFRHLVSNYEYDAVCIFWLARCYQLISEERYKYHDDNDDDCAKFYFQRAISLDPDNALFHSYYADYNLKKARMYRKPIKCFEYKSARVHLLKALTLKPCARFRLNYAKFLDEIEEEYERAKKHYKIVLEKYKMDSSVRLNYARLLHKMGNLKESKEEFEFLFKTLKDQNRSSSIEHKWIWPHFHYAKLLTDMKHYESARKEFEICIEIMIHHNKKFFADIYYEYAKLLLYAFNDHEDAYFYANVAIKAAPQKRYFKRLLYSIQDALYKKKENNDANDDNIESLKESVNEEFKTESEIAPINTGFGFKLGFGDYNYKSFETEQGGNFGEDFLNKNDGDLSDCGASIGKLSLSGVSNIVSEPDTQ